MIARWRLGFAVLALGGAGACALVTSFSGISDGVRDASHPADAPESDAPSDAPPDDGATDGGCCQAPTILASGQTSPSGIVVDPSNGGYVYWISGSGLMYCDPVCKKGPLTIPVGPSTAPNAAGLSSGFLVWSADNGVWGVSLSKLDAGAPIPIAPGGRPYGLTTAPAGAPDPVCFLTQVNTSLYCCVTAPADAGPCTLVGYHLNAPSGLAVGAPNQSYFFAGLPDAASSLGVFECGLACANMGKGSLLAQATTAGAIAVDTTNVYWTDNAAIRRAARNGPPMVATLYQGGLPTAVVADATGTLYFIDHNAGTLSRLPPGVGMPILMAKGLHGPSSLALGTSSVFWTNQDDGTVDKIAKCACPP